jgi:ABC-type antimicrobial peptide transport system permease subunit
MSLVNLKKILISGGVALFVLFFGLTASAQTDSFSFSVTPQNPDPFSSVSVSLSSFSVDMDRAFINWKVDGSLKLSGIGEKVLSVQVGAAGKTTVVEVEATFVNGQKIKKSLVLQPSNLDLLWEAKDSYTPPFYKGKALPLPEAVIKVVAVPEIKTFGGTTYNPESLVYEWKKGVSSQQNVSGFNKQYYSFRNSYFDQEDNISVKVSSQDRSNSAEKNTTINFFDPVIAVYKEDQKRGVVFSQNLTQESSPITGQANLVAVPYFFSATDISSPDLRYEWRVNERTIQNKNKKNEVGLTKSGEEGGFAFVELSIESISKLFQEARTSFNIELR